MAAADGTGAAHMGAHCMAVGAVRIVDAVYCCCNVQNITLVWPFGGVFSEN